MATPAWESWPDWAYLEAGSGNLRARVERDWGGLDTLARGRLALLASDSAKYDAFAAALGAIHDDVDLARPVRQLARRTQYGPDEWAIVFAAGAAARDRLPAICRSDASGELFALDEPRRGDLCAPCRAVERPADRAIVCGSGDAADALRADFLARGLWATADLLHAEQRDRWYRVPPRVAIELREDGNTLHGAIHTTPRTPPASSVTAAAFAAALRVQAHAPRVEALEPNGAFGLDVNTPLGFDSFEVAYTTPAEDSRRDMGYQSLIFVEMPVGRLAPHLVAFWRTFNSGSMTVRIEPQRVPAGFPAGTRRFRKREWIRDSGDIRACTPHRDHVGGCTVVGHRPPTTSLVNDADEFLIPADGGTWVAFGGDTGQVAAIHELVTSLLPPPPPTWALPAVAVGKRSTGRAELFWAEHLRDGGDLDLEIEGVIRP